MCPRGHNRSPLRRPDPAERGFLGGPIRPHSPRVRDSPFGRSLGGSTCPRDGDSLPIFETMFCGEVSPRIPPQVSGTESPYRRPIPPVGIVVSVLRSSRCLNPRGPHGVAGLHFVQVGTVTSDGKSLPLPIRRYRHDVLCFQSVLESSWFSLRCEPSWFPRTGWVGDLLRTQSP